MNILHVVSYFPPDRIGGVGEVAAHIHNGLLAEGHESRVLTSGSSRDDPRIVRVGRTPGVFGLASLRAWRLAAAVEVIHAHHGEALLFLTTVRVRRSRPRILLTMHIENRKLGDSHRPVVVDGRRVGGGWNAWLQRRVKSRLKALLDLLAMKLADQVTFISRSSARDVLGEAGAAQAIIVYNGLPALSEPIEEPDVEPVELLYVGTASARKRTDLLPAILDGVRRLSPGTRLRIVGFELGPGLRKRLEERRLLDAVVCEGPIRSEDLDRFYRSAQVLIVPSAYEGLPMVIMEAFRAGLPCVATDVGGASELIVDGVNGFLVPRDDVTAMARMCAEIVLSPTTSESLGAEARRSVEEFDVDRQTEAYLALYRKLATGVGHG